MGFSKTKILQLLFFLFSLVITTKSAAQLGFKCTQKPTAKCNSIIGYKTPNATTLSSLQNMFGVSDFNSLLGANKLPFSTKPSYAVRKDQVVKIPFPCACSNGTGISDGIPKYKVVEGNFVYYIANSIFMGFVTVDQIVEVNRNKIKDPSMINVGDEFIIPLPCSCDEVEEESVIHYGYLVEGGDSMEEIAKEYGTTSDLLFTINGFMNDSQLIAGKPIDIPLKACNSSINPNSLDYRLLVPNATYSFTANGCVKCKCDSANNWILECEPSGLTPANFTWSTCPPVQCNGADNLFISNTTTSGCNTSTCSYAGFNNHTILTALTPLSTCPATVPDSGNGDNNYASTSGFNWNLFHISLPLIMLSVHL